MLGYLRTHSELAAISSATCCCSLDALVLDAWSSSATQAGRVSPLVLKAWGKVDSAARNT